MANSKRQKRIQLDLRRRGTTIERQDVQEKRKEISNLRRKLEEKPFSAVLQELTALKERVIDLQEQVRLLQLESDEQRMQLRKLKAEVDNNLPDLVQNNTEQQTKVREDWQTLFEAGQTVAENNQDFHEHILELREKRSKPKSDSSIKDQN
jgi:hypothetical protein